LVYGAAPDMTALLTQAHALGLWALHPERHHVTPERVAAAHAASLRVNVWTVNDSAEIARLAAWGVDGILSDYPERVPSDRSRRPVT
jgi:glycerophosphoryl diester phosphodiesterase